MIDRAWVCRTCGVQYEASPEPPSRCAVCEDERQYLLPEGQRWTHHEELQAEDQGYEIRELEPGLTGLRCRPQLGIGPVGYLLATLEGNLLWDCPSFVDEAILGEVRKRGGISAISASHPHFYGAMVDWSDAFDAAPILLPVADREWAMRSSPAIRWWEGSAELLPGLRAVRCGGHFDGSSVLHWPAGAEGRGALLTGDTIMLGADRKSVSFMRSYPNLIPLGASDVKRILAAVEQLRYDRMYGNPGWDKRIDSGGPALVERSAERYVGWISR